jgi:hypothetical protein
MVLFQLSYRGKLFISDVIEQVRSRLFALISDCINCLLSCPPHFRYSLATSALWIPPAPTKYMDEKVIEVVCKYEELCFMLNIKYSNSY